MDEQIASQLAGLDQLVATHGAGEQTYNFFAEHYDLPGNPFPPSGIAGANNDGPPLRAEIFNQLIAFVRQGYAAGGSQFLVIRGDYGSGKTQTLRFIEHIVNTYMSKGEYSARAVYVERPRIEAQELNRTVLRSLGYDTVRKYVWIAIRGQLWKELDDPSEELHRLKQNLTTPRVKGRGNSAPGASRQLWDEDDPSQSRRFNAVFNHENTIDYRTFLSKLEEKTWSREDVRNYLVHLLLRAVGTVESSELAPAFVALLLTPDEMSYSSWESLVTITSSKAVASLRAPTFLQFLLKIMEINGIIYVYLLLDEFEEVSQTALLSLRQRQDYLYTMREVFNKIHRGLGVVIAISPPGWSALLSVATPLADVNHLVIDLSPAQLGEAVRLVHYYYDRERRGTKYDASKDIKPLSDELIQYILDNFPPGAQPTPRNLIQFLHSLLNYVAEESVVKLTPTIVQQRLIDFSRAKVVRGRATRGRRSADDADATA